MLQLKPVCFECSSLILTWYCVSNVPVLFHGVSPPPQISMPLYPLSSCLSGWTTPALCAGLCICCPASGFGDCRRKGRDIYAFLTFSRNSLGITSFFFRDVIPSPLLSEGGWERKNGILTQQEQCDTSNRSPLRECSWLTLSPFLSASSLLQNNADQVAFQVGGGLSALEQILQVVTAASTPTAVPRIPLKWVSALAMCLSHTHTHTASSWDTFLNSCSVSDFLLSQTSMLVIYIQL